MRIFTEGTQTEPNYFNAIREELCLRNGTIVAPARGFKGFDNHTLPLVSRVIDIKDSTSESDKDEWWVVFDRDDHDGFDEAIVLAEQNGIHVAYSNECFELWFILHFGFTDNCLGRDYDKKLSALLGRKYTKNDTDIYDDIKGKESLAIKNAKKLETMHEKNGVKSPLRRDPSTTVYKLVERLRGLKK